MQEQFLVTFSMQHDTFVVLHTHTLSAIYSLQHCNGPSANTLQVQDSARHISPGSFKLTVCRRTTSLHATFKLPPAVLFVNSFDHVPPLDLVHTLSLLPHQVFQYLLVYTTLHFQFPLGQNFNLVVTGPSLLHHNGGVHVRRAPGQSLVQV